MTRLDIEASYRLSPMQQGMLFHSLYSPYSGVYVQQMLGELKEELNVPAFRLAWQRIVERHGVLRTSFCLGVQEGPLQIVHQSVQLPFEDQDWRELSAAEQEQGLQNYLDADRRKGFDLNQAPLLRVALFRWRDADYRLIWTSHHALLDGRSRLLLIEELFVFYEAAVHGWDIQLKRPRPFKDYIDWLGKQDFSWSESFWREMLQDAIMPTPIEIGKAQVGGSNSVERSGSQVVRFSRQRTLELRELAEEHQVTLNTLIQGVWTLLLSRYSGKEEVVFGVTRACRKSALEGAESMVGVLINTLPVRVQVSPDSLFPPWLIDAYAPGYPRPLPWLEREVKLRILYHFKNLKKLSTKEKLTYFKEKAGILKARTYQQTRLLLEGVKRLLGKTKLGGEVLSVPRYEARVYPGKIILFSPSIHPEGVYPDPDMGWERLSGGGLEIHQISGEFGFIIKEPAVRILSEELEKCLSKAAART